MIIEVSAPVSADKTQSLLLQFDLYWQESDIKSNERWKIESAKLIRPVERALTSGYKCGNSDT